MWFRALTLILTLQWYLVAGIEPFTSMAAVASAAALFAAWSWNIPCYFKECCTDKYISLNYTGLKWQLNSKLHGQHLVIPTVLNSVKHHMTDPNPGKPLVLSFHGLTGGGKNFVSRIIVENIYKEKERSSFVHLFNSEIHFKHAEKVRYYKDQLHAWIFHNVSKCSRSTFIFDEMDHMPEGMIDVLIPFLGHSTHVDGVDFRKSIFIFLSNTGGDLIMKHVLRQWENGRTRESIKLREMQNVLELSAYNQQNGLKRSKLIHKNLVDHFIPFLPLERGHVRLCVLDELERQNITEYNEDIISEVLDELQWLPNNLNLYSKSGCKKISQKIAILGL